MSEIANTKVSTLINSQVPFFVRNDHPNFVRFVEAYYEWMEQNGETINAIKLLRDHNNIDETIDPYLEHFYNTFLKYFPENIKADKTLLLKRVKDFYLARGTERSVEFLLRVLYGDEAVQFYYPKRDILKVSDGKWYIEKSLKVGDLIVNGVANNDIAAVKKFTGTQIRGNTSNATALVEAVDVYYEGGLLVDELKLSNQTKDFASGETIFAIYYENGEERTIRANLFSGQLNTITIDQPGTGYKIGDIVGVEGGGGSGATVVVSSVSTGNIVSIITKDGGAGFQVGNPLLITGGGGLGGTANVLTVIDNGKTHPNSYNVISSQIFLEANTPLNNAVFSNLSSSNANTAIVDACDRWTYANTGPISLTYVINSGAGYLVAPSISASANSRIRDLGILGKMVIANPGIGYAANDVITFKNTSGGFGSGASARVSEVYANGAIKEVAWVGLPGEFIGGSGYSQTALPTANVVSANGVGADIKVTAVIGFGDQFQSVAGSIGSILSLSITNRGFGYTTPPTLNLSSYGDGTAQATATIITGIYTYPGRYINDDGHVSGYNFIEDKDYYQNNSYVVRLKKSLNEYRKPLKEMIHPAGMKLFGEYTFGADDPSVNVHIGGIMQTSNANYRLYPDNVLSPANTINLYAWVGGSNAALNNCTISLDSTEISPVGNTVLKMMVYKDRIDPFIGTYYASRWNLAPAANNQTWEVRVWSRSNTSTAIRIFGFPSKTDGTVLTSPSDAYSVGPDWSEKVFTFDTVANTTNVQVRLDGPQIPTTNAAIWFDGLQVRRLT